MFLATFESIKAAMEPVKEALTSLWNTVVEVFQNIWTAIEPVVTAIGVLIGAVIANAIAVGNGLLNALGPLVEAVVSAVNVMNIVGAIISCSPATSTGRYTSEGGAHVRGRVWAEHLEAIRRSSPARGSNPTIAESFGIDIGHDQPLERVRDFFRL